jgi:Ca2+-binding RTX toxin-like protein
MTIPTSEEQYLLELINEARIDPAKNAERYVTSGSPLLAPQASIQDALNYFGVNGSSLEAQIAILASVGPLAWSTALATAAQKHTAAMIAGDQQSHQLPGEATLGARVTAEGYAFTKVVENVYAYASDLLFAHAGFMVDWGYDAADYNGTSLRPDFATIADGMQDDLGHRYNIMNQSMREIGIGVTLESNPATQVGQLVITQDLGTTGKNFITGVAYTDKDGDGFYSLGEGRGDLVAKLGATSVTSFASGGYNLVAPNGAQTVTFTGGGLSAAVTVNTTIASDNVKIDIVNGKVLLTSASITVEGPVSEIRALGTKALTITAGTGAQTIYGTIANDVLSGGAGNDTIHGGKGDDKISGGDGTDTVVFAGRSNDYTVGTNPSTGVTLFALKETGNDLIDGVEIFRFGDGDFKLVDGLLTQIANSGNNTAGYNIVPGTSGADTQKGTAGADLFNTGAGNDTIDGLEGTDVVVYADNLNNYTIASRGTATILIGSAIGTDTITNVEIYRFKNGDFVKNSDGVMVAYDKANTLNQAPEVALSQNLSTAVNGPLTVKVIAFDAEQNTLTYTAGTAGHGSVSSLGGNQFRYTPTSGYSGYDSFKVTINDGNGGISTQTVNVGVGNATTVAPANQAPQVIATQLASTKVNTAVAIDIEASDPDGDTLTYIAGTAAHGTITGGTGGLFNYKPTNGYVGFDTFEVTVSDSKNATAKVTVNLLVEQATSGNSNTAPVVDLVQTVVLNEFGQSRITVSASDPDGDTLTYTASAPGQGSVTGGNSGFFTYVAQPTFANSDKFIVTVSDGKGGTSTQEITILEKLSEYQLLLSTGFKGSIGGNGSVFGTLGFQDITLLDTLGTYQLDGSFNRGGDIVRLPKAAGQYQVSYEATTAILSDGDTTYKIPFGSIGVAIVFSDGVRKLGLDTVAGTVKLGSQTLTTAPSSITAPSDGTVLPTGLNPAAQALMALGEGSDVSVSGKYSVFGTPDDERVRYLDGDLVLDGSFNRGGDLLSLPRAPSAYTAYTIGSTIVLQSVDGTITIPVGLGGLTLDFAGATRTLKIDTSASAIVVGDQQINATSAANAITISASGGTGGGTGGGAGGSEVSVDTAPASVVTQVNLTAGTAYTIKDNPDTSTNVVLNGFGQDDRIHVTKVANYAFTSGALDVDNVANDLTISYNDGSRFASIVVKDVVPLGKFVYDEASAEAAVGWNFISFG